MKYMDYSQICARGELGARCALLSARLEQPQYRPDVIYTIEQGGWPGDWEGRTVLALTCLARVTKREMSYLDEITDGLAGAVNERGYLGPVLPDGELDEQQLSGHSWLLRGLCEYYLYRRDEGVLDRIECIINNLFLPALGKYAQYPIEPEQRVYEGGESGSVAGVVGLWHISTDTGCAYIPLDGVGAAYEMLSRHRPDARRDALHMRLLREMAENFARIPFVGISAQTHATLTGCRGLLRLYGLTEQREYLSVAQSTFELYISKGMTPWYSNCNWFGRARWTEPCAVIDSFMVASQLYALTEDRKYAELSQLIYHNAICRAQRDNGGFGCDTCAGAEGGEELLYVCTYEAYWCCTMRGGEGLSRVAQYAAADADIPVLINPVGGTFVFHSGAVTVRTGYPYTGELSLTSSCDMRIKLFMPPWVYGVSGAGVCGAEDGYVTVELKKGETRLNMSIGLRQIKNEAGGVMYAHGVLILGTCDTGEPDISRARDIGGGCYDAGGVLLEPISTTYLKTREDISARKIRICFGS